MIYLNINSVNSLIYSYFFKVFCYKYFVFLSLPVASFAEKMKIVVRLRSFSLFGKRPRQ